MGSKLVFVLLLLALEACSSNLLAVDKSENILAGKMVNLVLEYHPYNSRSTVLLFGHLPSKAYHRLMINNIDLVIHNSDEQSTLSFTIPISGVISENFLQREVGIMVFYLENTKALAEALATITLTIHWASDAKMIIFISQNEDKALIFYLFWWYKSIDCIILANSEITNQISMYRYTPYAKTRLENQNQYGCWADKKTDEMYEGNIEPFLHCNMNCGVLDMNNWSEDMFIQTCIEIEIFSKKTRMTTLPSVRNFQGYPLCLQAFGEPLILEIDNKKEGFEKFAGRDAYLLKALADKLNFTVKHKTIEKSNEAYVFSFYDLSFRRYDISFNSVYLQPVNYPQFDVLYPVEQNGRCFVVHRAGQVPAWHNLFRLFDRTSFGLLIILFHVVILNYYFFIRFSRKSSIFQSIVLAYMYSIQLFLLYPVDWVSKHNYLRFLVFMVFWCVFVLNFMFQGLIISFFTVPSYGAEINTFADLYKTNFSLEGVPFPELILTGDDVMLKKLNKRFVQIFDALACPKDLIETNTKGCWLKCPLADFVHKTYRDKNGNLPIHVGKDKMYTFYKSYLLWYDSPLTGVLNLNIRALSEGGILQHWQEMFVGTGVESQQTDVQVLTLQDLQGCFYMLLIGNVLAFVVLLLELLSNKIVTGKFSNRRVENFKAKVLSKVDIPFACRSKGIVQAKKLINMSQFFKITNRLEEGMFVRFLEIHTIYIRGTMSIMGVVSLRRDGKETC